MITVTGLDWQRQAACAGRWDLFFAEEAEYPHEREAREAEAKALCAGCPVSRPCLEYRLSFESQADDGLWSGLGPAERANMRRNMLRSKTGKAAV